MIKELLESYLIENLSPKKENFFQIGRIEKNSSCKKEDIERNKSIFIQEEALQESSSISNYIKENKEEDCFQTKLFSMIDEKNLKDSDVYKKANIDRRLFSKIRSNKDYHPSKETILLLGFALELTEEEMEKLLELASYSLPKNNTYDLIIRFCFKERIYDINQVNEFLFDHHCKTLME
ncbi:MAG: hypothetical protein IKE70_06365 [Bacilli bacterium]|nr:hypothetical protein [Bacilli bacterium]